MKRRDTPSREDMMNFSLLIESLVKESGSNYLEAVTEYCSDNDIDFEVAASLIDQNLKFKIENDAKNLNLIKKKNEPRLPL